jgi:hypothetical protein
MKLGLRFAGAVMVLAEALVAVPSPSDAVILEHRVETPFSGCTRGECRVRGPALPHRSSGAYWPEHPRSL